MRMNSKKYAVLLGLVFGVTSLMTASAQSTIVTFSVDMATNIANGTFIPGTDTVSVHGTFDGWGAGLNLAQEGSSSIYTNTLNNTTDANGSTMQYKFVDSNAAVPSGGYESLPTGQNRAAKLPANSGDSLVLPTPFFADAGANVTNYVTFRVDVSQQIALGNFTPGTDFVVVRGGLINGWAGVAQALTNDTSIVRTNQYGLVTSNVWVGTFPITNSPAGMVAFKYVIPNHGTIGDEWETPSTANQDGGGNRYFANVAQTLPIVDFSDAPYAPIASITFSVDMTVVALTDTNYDSSTVTIWGDFNSWSGGLAMTNDPSASNTNIYTSPIISSGVGSTINYQFRYAQLSTGNTIYDHLNGANGGQGNRTFLVPNVASTNVPPVVFNDAELNDYLLQPTPVFFSVNMAGAVGTDGHTFDQSVDSVYINGQFANWYPWASGITPQPAPPEYQLFQEGSTLVYTNTITMASGTPVNFFYKYGMDIGSINGGPADDEAGFGTNHFGVVRSTAFNPYVMPPDKFGNSYAQPFFNANSPGGGQLTIGPVSGGTIPVTWLGRPGAQLQVSTDLAGGSWQSLPETDGTNWTIGYYNPTNGFVSQTNWPATNGKVFFRLTKP